MKKIQQVLNEDKRRGNRRTPASVNDAQTFVWVDNHKTNINKSRRLASGVLKRTATSKRFAV